MASALGGRHVEEETRRVLEGLGGRLAGRREMIGKYREAYLRYCWEVADPDDMKLAPFHLLAGGPGVFTDRPHLWHMGMAERLGGADPGLFLATRWRDVDVEDEESVAAAVAWWEGMTAAGGEGMVVKPLDFVARGRRGVVQPAVKCRGKEYLRIIYGPDYDAPENLERLRQRGLGHKRSMAEREFALGLEGLERFVAGKPLREVHECVLAVLALESEPGDPRL